MNRLLGYVVVVILAATHAVYGSSRVTVAHTFACTLNQACPQGGSPETLLQGSDGNFYGVTQVSSTVSSQPDGGTIFSVTPAGKFTLLHTFLPGPNNKYPDGSVPGPMIEGPDGNLYGTTFYGGTSGFGVLYRIGKQGGFQVIHQFGSSPNLTDGFPGGKLVLGQDGNIYGSTTFGGTGVCYQSGCGTIFRVTLSSAAYDVVFNFGGSNSGDFPSPLTAAPDGTLLGLSNGLFHFSPATGAFTVVPLNLPRVRGLPAAPFDLTIGPNGKLYGLYSGYSLGGAGLFEVDLDGSNLQEFPQYRTTHSDGGPSGLLLATDGNFWIAESTGGNGTGDLIKISPSTGALLGTLSLFGPSTRVGTNPAALIQAKDGRFWGSTAVGGTVPTGDSGAGVVYRLNAGLPPR